jgi:hypothetical protein
MSKTRNNHLNPIDYIEEKISIIKISRKFNDFGLFLSLLKASPEFGFFLREKISPSLQNNWYLSTKITQEKNLINFHSKSSKKSL